MGVSRGVSTRGVNMVKTRSSARTSDKKTQIQQAQDDTNKELSVQEMAALAFSKIQDKLSSSCHGDSESSSNLPDLLLLNSDDEDKSESKKALNNIDDHKKIIKLASSLDPGMEGVELYFDISPSAKTIVKRFGDEDPDKDLMKKSVITSDFEKKAAAPLMHQSRHKLQKLKKAEREKSTGSNWFDMPAPEMTEELKNDLKILQMRNTLDRTHYYKNTDWKKLPKFFQLGTVVEGPGEFYSARIPKKQRKCTIVEELLADQKFKRYQKQKYTELQKKKQVLRQRQKKRVKTKRGRKSLE